MGWLRDLWDSLIEWLADWLRRIVRHITDGIAAYLALFRYWKHRLAQQVAEWLKNDTVFIATVVGAILVGVYLPQIWTWFQTTLIYGILRRTFELAKKNLASMINVRLAIDLKAISDILAIVWPEWKKATDSINGVLAGWAEELGQGSGFLHAYFACAYSITASAGAVTGLPAQLAALEWYDRARTQTKRIDDRFERYAAHPEQIYSDMMEEWLIPQAEDEGAVHRQNQDTLRDHWERMMEINRAVIDAKESIDVFVKALPDEIEAVVNKRWLPFSRQFDTVMESFQAAVLDKVQDIMDVLAERERRLDDLQAAVERNSRTPLPLIAASEEWTDEERNLWAAFVWASVLQRRGEEQAEGVPETFVVTDDSLRRLEAALVGLPVMPSLMYEPQGITAPVEKAEARLEDWFVGEF